MKIIKLVKTKENKYEVIIFNIDLTLLCPKETFEDLYTLNFYLQSMQKKFNFDDSLIILHDKFYNTVEILKTNGEIFLE
jgi:hypothetical protein